jgi:CRISPR-associated Cas5-like protein
MSNPPGVLRAVLDVPHEAAFYKSDAMNGLPTYPIPPVTTIQGLLYAALGRPSLLQPNQLPNDLRRDEEAFRERVRDECRFGERVLDRGTQSQSLRSRQKAASSKDEEAYVTYPTQAQTILAPSYQIYIGGPDQLLEAFESALRDPERLLYLGRSDDLVTIRDIDILKTEYVDEQASLDCVVPGGGGDPVLLPVRPDYRDRYSARHPGKVRTVSISGGPVDGYFETSDGDRFVYITE